MVRKFFKIGTSVLVLLLLALAGCSGAQPTATPAPTQQPTEPPPTLAPEPTATAETVSTTAASSTEPAATATLPPASPTPATFAPASFQLGLELVAQGLDEPLYATHAGDGSGRIFVVEQPGTIRVITDGQVNPTPFLDITQLVGSRGNEQGLLSVAFHPDYVDNGYLFVNYTDNDGNTVVARYSVSNDPNVADPNSAQVILTLDQPAGNHNGGLAKFGPDGYLYVGTGDGGRAGDPWGNAQNPEVLLGKMLRIDVDSGDPYGIPPDNPFVNDANARDEIWALGMRNPWRFSFDRATDDLYIGDVGQSTYEEVDFEPADSPGGRNYGWNVMEGRHCYSPSSGCDQSGLVLPVAEYSHQFGCSITGGYVYRGSAFPQMTGAYFYGDYCSGIMWALYRDAAGEWQTAQVLQSGRRISSFGQDEAGELYLTALGSGELYRLVAE